MDVNRSRRWSPHPHTYGNNERRRTRLIELTTEILNSGHTFNSVHVTLICESLMFLENDLVSLFLLGYLLPVFYPYL